MSLGSRRHLVRLQSPGIPVPDQDGGFVDTWADLVPPTLYVSIEPATAQSLERITAGTVMSSSMLILKGAYHAQITTKTRVLFNGRRLDVVSVMNPGEQGVRIELVCVEVEGAAVVPESWMQAGWTQ